jgi:hypothetical protein
LPPASLFKGAKGTDGTGFAKAGHDLGNHGRFVLLGDGLLEFDHKEFTDGAKMGISGTVKGLSLVATADNGELGRLKVRRKKFLGLVGALGWLLLHWCSLLNLFIKGKRRDGGLTFISIRIHVIIG